MKTKSYSIKEYLLRIIAIAMPMIIQGVVFQIQSLTDKAFLGHVDTVYISALGAAQFPFGATIDCVFALAVALVIFVSRAYGAQEHDKIRSYVKSYAFYTSIISLFMFMMWFFKAEFILRLLSVDEEIIGYSVTYVRICSVYFLILGIDCALQSMLQGIGHTKPIMVAGIIKVVLNIIISWVLIYGKFGLPARPVEGAAIGTLVANILSVVMIVVYCFIIKGKEYLLHINNRLWFSFRSFREVVKVGIPSALEYFLWNASNLVLLRFLNGISYIATTIYTLTFGVEIIVYAIYNGMSKAAMTLIGQSIGENDNKKGARYMHVCVVLNVVLVLITIVIFALIPDQILSIFTNKKDIVEESAPYLIFTGFILLPKCINVVIGNGIRAYGDTRWMLFTQTIGSVLVVSCSYILVRILDIHVVAIYITLFFDEATRAIINYIHYQRRYGIKKDCKSL